MGDPKQKIGEELLDLFWKMVGWAAYIVPTIVAKLAWDKKTASLSRWQIFLKVVVSLFIGYLVAVACESYGWQKQGRLAVPVATLWSDSLMNLIMSKQNKIERIVDKYFSDWFKSKPKKRK